MFLSLSTIEYVDSCLFAYVHVFGVDYKVVSVIIMYFVSD